MHRSRVGVVLIDHPVETYAAAAAFWAGARGSDRDPSGPAEDNPYQSLAPLAGLMFELQRTGEGTAPRIHLDIETDNVPAEVERVVALGATVVEEREGYTILTDPGGLLFCIVPVQTGAEFEAHATTWE